MQWLESMLPRHIWVWMAVYACASLAHFTHNAEYIAFYPNMPAGLTREHVYLVWLAITSMGLVGLACVRFGWRSSGMALLALYGATGLDGLGHYTLALCSEHTLAMNLTIWGEALAGVLLAVSCLLTLRPRRPAALVGPSVLHQARRSDARGGRRRSEAGSQ